MGLSLIERDIKDLMCPLAVPDDRLGVRCAGFAPPTGMRCRNPREWQSCAFFSGNWEGL